MPHPESQYQNRPSLQQCTLVTPNAGNQSFPHSGEHLAQTSNNAVTPFMSLTSCVSCLLDAKRQIKNQKTIAAEVKPSQ